MSSELIKPDPDVSRKAQVEVDESPGESTFNHAQVRPAQHQEPLPGYPHPLNLIESRNDHLGRDDHGIHHLEADAVSKFNLDSNSGSDSINFGLGKDKKFKKRKLDEPSNDLIGTDVGEQPVKKDKIINFPSHQLIFSSGTMSMPQEHYPATIPVEGESDGNAAAAAAAAAVAGGLDSVNCAIPDLPLSIEGPGTPTKKRKSTGGRKYIKKPKPVFEEIPPEIVTYVDVKAYLIKKYGNGHHLKRGEVTGGHTIHLKCTCEDFNLVADNRNAQKIWKLKAATRLDHGTTNKDTGEVTPCTNDIPLGTKITSSKLAKDPVFHATMLEQRTKETPSRLSTEGLVNVFKDKGLAVTKDIVKKACFLYRKREKADQQTSVQPHSSSHESTSTLTHELNMTVGVTDNLPPMIPIEIIPSIQSEEGSSAARAQISNNNNINNNNNPLLIMKKEKEHETLAAAAVMAAITTATV